MPYLKDLLIQDSGPKDSDALRVDNRPVTSAERLGHLLFTVHNNGNALLLHADGHTVPSVKHSGKTHRVDFSLTACVQKNSRTVVLTLM